MARMRQSSARSAPLTSTWPPANEVPHSAMRDASTSPASASCRKPQACGLSGLALSSFAFCRAYRVKSLLCPRCSTKPLLLPSLLVPHVAVQLEWQEGRAGACT